MMDKKCIVCNQALSQESFNGLSLHDWCFPIYQQDIENQEVLLQELRILFNNNIAIGTELVSFDDILEGQGLPQSLVEIGSNNYISISKDSGYVTSISLEGSFKDEPFLERNFKKNTVERSYTKALSLITQFKKLEHIELKYIGDLGFVQANFSHLTFLDELILDTVSFTLPPDCFILSPSVSLVLLCNIPYIELFLTGLPENLQILSIDSTNLLIFPEFICSLSGLKELDISNTGITEIPATICNLSNLEILSLSENKIKFLPDSICQLTHLTDIDLSVNLLDSCSAIHDLPLLSRIDLSNNIITDISSLTTLPALTTLSADYNNISSIPSSFQNLVSLKNLSLIGNIICDLPDLSNLLTFRSFSLGLKLSLDTLSIICKLTSLETLQISEPELQAVPECLANFTKLKGITLNTQKKHIPEFLFNLPAIEFIGIYVKEKLDTNYESIIDRIFYIYPLDERSEAIIDEYFFEKYSNLKLKFKRSYE